MIFWILAALATALAVAVMVRPLVRKTGGVDPSMAGADSAPDSATDSATDAALQVYRAQLEEIDRDRARGVTDDEQAAAARAEVGRRMIALSRSRQQTQGASKTEQRSVSQWRKIAALTITIVVPLAVLGLYLPTGSPDLPSQPLAGRDVGDREARLALQQDARTLQAALAEDGDDIVGWLRLGSLLSELEDHDGAVNAFANAVSQSSGDPRITSLYAEAVVNADSGVVTREARLSFEQVLEAVPDDPRARFYLALAREQAGDLEGALDRWVALAAETPADAPWLGMVRAQISQTAIRVGLDVGRVMPDPLPPAGDRADMAAMDPASAAQLVTALEDALSDTPERLDYWLRLGELRGQLGDHQGAAAAFATALEHTPDDLPDEQKAGLLQAQAAALMAAGDGDMGAFMTPEFITVMTALLTASPTNDQALWFLGAAAEEAGDAETARAHWSVLLDTLPPDSEAAALLQQRLEQL